MIRRSNMRGRALGAKHLLAGVAGSLLLGPATGALAAKPSPAAPAPMADGALRVYDPWERFNRASYAFNAGLDRVLISPLIQVYTHLTPSLFRRGLGNVIDNVLAPRTVINDVLQGHPGLASEATARLIINTSAGLGGLIDVATRLGVARHRSDFGQTLGRYGAAPGPFLFVPIFGPTNLRDGLGFAADAAMDPVPRLVGDDIPHFGLIRFGVIALDARTSAEASLRSLRTDTTNPYATIRAAYSQNREFLVRRAAGRAEALPDFDTAAPEPAPEPSAEAAPGPASHPSPEPAPAPSTESPPPNPPDPNRNVP